MKNNNADQWIIVCATLLSGVLSVSAQDFVSGSTGADGALNVTTDRTIQLPPNGILNYTTVNVAEGATLTFFRNALNTPVYMLATSNVTISGTIDVSGKAPIAPFAGGVGGPGGFDGGPGGFTASGGAITRAGAGLGPGAGRSGNFNFGVPGEGTAGSGAYSTRGDFFASYQNPKVGQVYGSSLLIPIVGGSGGGGIDGDPNGGGSGGGGALLIASSTLIQINSNGRLQSYGGSFNEGDPKHNLGSGGAIRLVAPRVYGNGTITVPGGFSRPFGMYAGSGRIRIDSIFKYEPTNAANQNLSINFFPNDVTSVGSTMIVFPPNNPRLDLVKAAGRDIVEGTGSRVNIQLPFGSDTNQTVTIQARDFNRSVPIRVVLTPASGDPLSYDATINNPNANNPAQAVVPVKIPMNQVVEINAWTR